MIVRRISLFTLKFDIFELEVCSNVLKEDVLVVVFGLGVDSCAKMFQMEEKNSRTFFFPKRTNNVTKVTKNVWE